MKERIGNTPLSARSRLWRRWAAWAPKTWLLFGRASRGCIVLLALAGLAWGCQGSPPTTLEDAYWGSMATGRIGPTQPVGLVAQYFPSTELIYIQAFAQVPEQTPAVVELTGARHMLCQGTFGGHGAFNPGSVSAQTTQKYQAYWAQPILSVSGNRRLELSGPRGNYVATLRIDSLNFRISKLFSTSPGPTLSDGSYITPAGCQQVG